MALAVVAAACVAPSSTATASPRGAGTPPLAEPTPATGPATVVQSPWGPIWNAVPPEFLVFAGAQPIEIETPASAALDHPAQAASPSDVAGAYVTDLGIAGWQTTSDGPLEDGSMVVDAVRDGTSCQAQVRATPLGGVVRITILYGAACPAP
jgi:hypothetical protein